MTQAAQTSARIDAAKENWASYVRDRDAGHLDYVKQAKSYDEYYLGNQWDTAIRNKLEKEGRPALTINLILSTINAALGAYAQRQASLRYTPKREGTHESAQAITKLVMHILEQNDFQAVEWDMVVDGFIQERGYIDARVDFSGNMLGEVRLKAIDPLEIVLDADAKEYDPSTWTKVTRTYWMTLDEVEAEFGVEKRRAIEARVSAMTHQTYDSIDFDDHKFGPDNSAYTFESGDDMMRHIRSVRVVSRQHRRMAKAWHFVSAKSGDISQVPPGWDEARMRSFAAQFGLHLTTITIPRIRWTVTADNVVLHDDWSLYRSFSIIPFFPYFRRGKPMGMVRNLIGPQDHLNKSTSQELHIVNTTANSGWTVEDGTLVNMSEDELATRGAETGLVLVHTRGSNPPAKIQPNPIPTGLDMISNKSRMFLREISGLEGVLGIASPEISGVALEGKEARADIQLQTPFVNLARTRNLLGRKLLELVQQFYTEERIILITRDVVDSEEPQVEELAINQPSPEGAIVNDITFGEYSVSITTSPPRDSFDDQQFAEVMQMRAANIAIPDYVAVRYSRLADKFEIAKHLKELMGQAQPTEQELQMMQAQQEMQMRAMEAEIAKLEAEVEKVKADAMLSYAKAEQQTGGEQSPEHLRHIQSLEAKVQQLREANDLRRELAMLSHVGKQQQSGLSVAAQLAMSKNQTDAQLEVARLNAAKQKSQGAKKPTKGKK